MAGGDIQSLGAPGVYRIRLSDPEQPPDLRRNRFVGGLVAVREQQWKAAMQQAEAELGAVSEENDRAQRLYLEQLKAVRQQRKALQDRISDLRDGQITADEAARKHNADATNRARNLYAQQKMRADQFNANAANDAAERAADAAEKRSTGTKTTTTKKEDQLPGDTAEAVKQSFVDTRRELGVLDNAATPVQPAFNKMRQAMADDSLHRATDGQRTTAHRELFEQLVGDLRDRTGASEAMARAKIWSELDDVSRERLKTEPPEETDVGGMGAPATGGGAPPQTLDPSGYRPDTFTPTDRSGEIDLLQMELDKIQDPERPTFRTDTDLIGRAQRAFGQSFGQASRLRGTPKPAAQFGSIVARLEAQGMSREQAVDAVLRSAGVRGGQPSSSPQAPPVVGSGDGELGDFPFPLTDEERVQMRDPVGRALDTNPGVPIHQLQRERQMVRDRARSGEMSFQRQIDRLLQQDDGARTLRAEARPDDGGPKFMNTPAVGPYDRGGPSAMPTRTPQQADRLARTRSVSAGNELAKRPKRLRRLVSNTDYGKHVARLHAAARSTDDYDPKHLQNQVVKAYRDPTTQQRALEVLVALDINADGRSLAGQSTTEPTTDPTLSTSPAEE